MGAIAASVLFAVAGIVLAVIHKRGIFAAVGLLVAIVVFLLAGITVVPAGNVGVVDVFGNVRSTALQPGVQWVNPVARVRNMSIKTQEIKEVMDVPSREGLTVGLEVSVLYHLNPEKAPQVYKTVGREYVGVILEPQFRSAIRGVTSGYDAKALYTSEREHLSRLILNDIEKQTAPRGVTVESVPLRKVTLPPGLTESIESKLRAEQDSQRMQFVLTKEKQEADRKRIEAQGIADFQTIVSHGISEPLLRWKGIEATELLAKSSNTKIVVIGNSKDGLPLILGGVQ